ncbi:MAG: hypothetical protein KFB93_05580 [Simkaniaceae bacterium]|nr:MAG: hypothetical protein KFB93_05580 [Simkaniaceae bacterium]
MDFTPTSSRSCSRSSTPEPTHDLSHTVGEAMLDRTPPAFAPRIKVGDKYYHVVRIEGGQYQNPISNPRELEKAQKIGEVLLSAHKKVADQSPALTGRKIDYIDSEGVHYVGGETVFHDNVRTDPADSTQYLKATEDFAWQQPVKGYETHLDSLPHSAPIQHQALPPFLKGFIRDNPRYRQHTYSLAEVKQTLLDYTREKLYAVHDIYAKVYHDPHRQERQRTNEREWIDRHPSATIAIEASNNYVSAGYLTASHVWQKLVDTLQPAEYRFIPIDQEEEEDPFSASFSSHSSSFHGSGSFSPPQRSQPIPIPVRRAAPLDLDSGEFSSSPLSPRSPRRRHSDPLHLAHPIHHASSSPSLVPHPTVAQVDRSPLHSPRGIEHSPRPRSVPLPTSSELLTTSVSPIFRGQEDLPLHRPVPRRASTPIDFSGYSSSRSPSPLSVDSPRVVPLRQPSPHLDSGSSAFSLKSSRERLRPPSAMPQERRERYSSHKLTYLDQPDYRMKGTQYKALELAAKRATSNDWVDARESKRLCETALQKFKTGIVDTLTPKELSVVKRIIEIREGNKSDHGAFGRLPMSERYRAVADDLEQYTGRYAAPLSKGH